MSEDSKMLVRHFVENFQNAGGHGCGDELMASDAAIYTAYERSSRSR